jgi:hypothetical protein
MIEIIMDPNNEDTARFYCGDEKIAEVTRIMISPNVGEYVMLRETRYCVESITHNLHNGDVSYEVVEV